MISDERDVRRNGGADADARLLLFEAETQLQRTVRQVQRRRSRFLEFCVGLCVIAERQLANHPNGHSDRRVQA